MKLKKIIASAFAAVMCAVSLTACSNSRTSSTFVSSDNTESSSVQSADTNVSSAEEVSSAESSVSDNDTSVEESSSSAETSVSDNDTSADGKIKVVALKGPTAMGLVKMMSDDENEYDFQIVGAVDEISPMAAQGTADIMCVPANLASVLYNKTEGKVKAAAVNTLGVLYICGMGDEVKTVADLKGKTIYSAGKGATPEYALNFILKSNDIDPETDVTIEWKSEHTECLTSLLADENSVAMLPQPFVTTAQTKNESVKVLLDLNKEWDNLGLDSSLITGAAVVRTEFAEQHPDELNDFLTKYQSSVEFINNNIDEGAALVGQYDIVPEAVAKKAIPNCNIVCITGDEMKTKLAGYLQVLADSDIKAVGGTLPDDNFYYIAG